MSEIDDLLENFGESEKQGETQWDKVIVPKASYLVTGDVGTGKSGRLK